MTAAAANYGTAGLAPRTTRTAQRATPAVDMVERKEPDFVKFTEGEVIEGVLVNVERIQVGNPPKSAVRYTLADVEDGSLICFLGSYQIDTKLRPSDKGHYITVRYEGEDTSVKRNGNSMKRFKVFVSAAPYISATATGNQLEDGTFITNDDIGF